MVGRPHGRDALLHGRRARAGDPTRGATLDLPRSLVPRRLRRAPRSTGQPQPRRLVRFLCAQVPPSGMARPARGQLRVDPSCCNASATRGPPPPPTPAHRCPPPPPPFPPSPP